MAESGAVFTSGHTIQVPVSILRELARRLQLIQKFRSNFLTKTELEIQNSVRSAPLRREKFTPVWWSSKSDCELLLGSLCGDCLTNINNTIASMITS